MDSSSGFVFLRFSDGASLQQRIYRMLDSDPFALDERTLRELLEFARRYTNTLKFFNPDDKDAHVWKEMLHGNLDQLIEGILIPPAQDGSPDNPKLEYNHQTLLLFFIFWSSGVDVNTATPDQLNTCYQQAFDAWRDLSFKPIIGDETVRASWETLIRAILEFGQNHADALQYFDPNNREAGDWSVFLDGDIDVLVACLNQASPDEPVYPYSRLARALTFLDLLNAAVTKGGLKPEAIDQAQLDSYFQQAIDWWRESGFQPALIPEKAGLQALVAFAQAQAATLRPFIPKNGEAIDWSVFLTGDVDSLIAGLKAPTDPEHHQSHAQLALFLTFIALLYKGAVEMDKITRLDLSPFFQKALYLRQKPGFEALRFRDGTSQQRRISGALYPDFFALDERSLRDLLEFARRYAGTITYFDRDNREAGDWSAFLDADIDMLVGYLKDPASFDDRPEIKDRFSQPHLALFLTFLALLQRAQVQMNTITRRQLEFYYRQALGFRQKAGTPDRVHVLAQLEDEVDELLIPEGTLLFAGEDAAGDPVLYRAEEDLIANHARLAQVMSLHVDKEVTTLFSIREKNEDKTQLIPVLLEVLSLTYRQQGTENTPRWYPNNQPPNPPKEGASSAEGGIIPPGQNPGKQPNPPDRLLNEALIGELDKVQEFITENLQLRISAFQYIVELYEAWKNLSNWERSRSDKGGINDYLRKAGRKPVEFPLSDPRDFDTNLKKNLGVDLRGQPVNARTLVPTKAPNKFKDLEGVNDFYDLYTRYLLLKNTGGNLTRKEPVEPVIQKIFDLNFSVADFEAMMKIRIDTLGFMRKIVQVLRNAVATQLFGYGNALPYTTVETLRYLEKDEKLHHYYSENQTFAGLIKYVCRLNIGDMEKLAPGETNFNDDFFTSIATTQLADMEKYFRMPAEDYFFIRNLFVKPPGKNWEYNTPAWKWRRADDLLKKAHRDIMLRPDFNAVPGKDAKPVSLADLPAEPEIIRWKNVYVAREANRIIVPGFDEKEEFPRWKTFGKTPVPEEAELIETGELGFVLATPALKLAEGKRQLTLELQFEKSHFDSERLQLFFNTLTAHLKDVKEELATKNPNATNIAKDRQAARDYYPFTIAVSTEKEWITIPDWAAFEITSNDPNDPNDPKITITLLLNEEIPPLAPVDGDPCPSPWPALKLILNRKEIVAKDKNDNETERRRPYELFRGLLLKSVRLSVTVTGLTQLQVQNLDGSVDPKKPFEPFGPEPRPGERLFIAHPELAAQRLDSLTLKLNWDGMPANLATYYAAYTTLGAASNISGLEADKFNSEVEVSIREAHRSLVLPPAAESTRALSAELKWAGSQPQVFTPNNVPYERKLNPEIADDLPDSDRYLQIELKSPDFQHRRYASLLAMAVANGNQTLVLPEPHTPVLNGISADYTTSVQINLSDKRDTATDRLLYLHPFGMSDMEKSGDGEWVSGTVMENGEKKTVSEWQFRFLPRFDDEGQLFLGVENLRPPQTLSLLFQLAEGTSNPDLPQAKLEWACLAGEKWRVLGDEYVLHDTTNGLLNSGVIRLAVPDDASLEHSLMPAGLHWIRVSVRRFAESLSDTIAIHTQAFRAVWVDPGSETLQKARILPAGSIVESYDPLPGLSELVQPYSSFFGKPAEQAPAFYQRVSERLRHKNRALTMWDYERLVLENFPDIYKVKALATDLLDPGAPPGAVSVIVIPDIRFRRPFNPFEPKVQQGRLIEIQNFLQQLAPPFAQVQVQNPRFDYLSMRVMVRFHDMINFNFYADRLQREIKQYLSPWAFDDAGEITFGKDINLSMLVYFMETRPYVDFIDKPVLTVLERRVSDGAIEAVQIGGAIQLRGPDVIFVSAPNHTIDPLDDTIAPADRIREGIGHAKIELDFNIPRI